MAPWNFGLERYAGDQNLNKACGYVPVVQRNCFQNLTTPLPRGEKSNIKTVPWVPEGSPGGRPTNPASAQQTYVQDSK